jgi:transcriptional regulator with XRE-family HTH domain
MAQDVNYDYRELAYDIYRSADNLLDELVTLRKRRGMTQQDLADAMNVSQAYISQIENGRTNMVSLLIDYALEVGARLDFSVEAAEAHSAGMRFYTKISQSDSAEAIVNWDNDEMSLDSVNKEIVYTVKTAEGRKAVDVMELPKGKGEQGEAELLAGVGRREHAH